MEKLRNILESAIEAERKRDYFCRERGTRLPNTSCLATPGWKGETQVMQMDLAGFAISAGSACSSGKVKASAVLTRDGADDGRGQQRHPGVAGTGDDRERCDAVCRVWLTKREKHRARAA